MRKPRTRSTLRSASPAAQDTDHGLGRGSPRTRVFLLLVALGAGVASAQETVTAVAGAGSRTCEQMQADIADLPNVRRAYVSWMQGYLSGRNAAREAAQLELVDIADYEAQWEWIVGWCAERPERGFVEAVGAMFDDRAARLPAR